MDQTPNLSLPYILAAQAQKHVTHNEAIRALDALVQIGVADRDLADPPASPTEGDRYIVAAAATGAWVGQAGKIAAWQDGAWAFYLPRRGWLAWVADEGALVAWNGTAWIAAGGGGGGSVNPAPLVGVNTTADATSRLAVKSDAVLFSHDDVTPGTGDMRVKYNKSAANKTASFLFQNGFSGRAEVGLTGDDKLHVKTSPDGVTWTDMLVIDPATGRIGIKQANPQEPLHVVGNVRIQDGAAFFGFYNSAGTVRTGYFQAHATAGFFFVMELAQPMYLYTNNQPRHFIGANGQHGFGTASPSDFASFEGIVGPQTDNAYTMGTAAKRWSTIYAATGTINTSDARDKEVAGGLPFAGTMVDAIDPILFRWKAGSTEVIPDGFDPSPNPDQPDLKVPRYRTEAKPGKRLHAGWRAQDLRTAMNAAGIDFAAWGLDDRADPESRQWVRPDQLTAVLWAALKETRAEVAALSAQIASNQTPA